VAFSSHCIRDAALAPRPHDDARRPRAEESIDRYYRAIAGRNLTEWLATLAENVTIHEPAESLPAEGYDGAQEAWKVLTAPFRELRYERLATHFSGAGAAVLWRCSAIGVNGGHAGAEGITVFEFSSDGRIETVVSYWDPAALLIALAAEGAEPTH
jgi:ketosteroid isomerase-like protein